MVGRQRDREEGPEDKYDCLFFTLAYLAQVPGNSKCSSSNYIQIGLAGLFLQRAGNS